jgi:hypothetical protein
MNVIDSVIASLTTHHSPLTTLTNMVEVLTLVSTQAPIVGAFVWFLIYFTKQVAENEKRRDEWFTMTLANQDKTFKDGMAKVIEGHARTTERICERLDKMKTTMIACKYNRKSTSPKNMDCIEDIGKLAERPDIAEKSTNFLQRKPT